MKQITKHRTKVKILQHDATQSGRGGGKLWADCPETLT